MTNDLRFASSERLSDPGTQALYGREAVQAELARRSGAVWRVDLRGEDVPKRSALEQARMAAANRGEHFSVCAFLGIVAGRSRIGDQLDHALRERECERDIQKQRHQHALTRGSSIRLPDGTELSELEHVTVEMLGPHAGEVLTELRRDGIISSIDPDVAWLRSLPETIGPWVATREITFSNGRSFKRGQSVSESDVPLPKIDLALQDSTQASTLTVADLRRIIADEINARIPNNGPPVPPPMSEWQMATSARHGFAALVMNPNYREPSAAAPKGKSK